MSLAIFQPFLFLVDLIDIVNIFEAVNWIKHRTKKVIKMNGQQQGGLINPANVANLGAPKPILFLLHKEDVKEFETEWNKLVSEGWSASPMVQQTFYDDEDKKMVTSLFCAFYKNV